MTVPLTPIVKTPEKAIINKKTKGLLFKLSKSPLCKVAIISGRSLKNIKQLLGLNGIIYVGNHGFEIFGPRLKLDPGLMRGILEFKEIKNKIKRRLEGRLKEIKGAFIEDKGISLTLHYRKAKKKDVPLIKAILRAETIVGVVKDKLKIKKGKMVLELRPATNWDKGKVSRWLIAKEESIVTKGLTPIYVGDDYTDEDAFKAIKQRGLTVFVGNPRDSHAEYFLKNSKDVVRFLQKILCIKMKDKSWKN
ncbi:MAG: trehalose-phosphatase [Candidatus Omnitrophota bacterium]